MFKRYEIAIRETPPLREVPNKFHPVVDRIRLAGMLVREAFRYRFRKDVLLSRPCIYGVFSGPLGGFMPRRSMCVGCMRCVQEYPEICQVFINPKWKALGDSYFTPDSVSTLNYEATTGKILVKGVGYKGPFAGPGFDSMWTDMSEIVRPTRDGIYGREYISTAVDVGRKARCLDPENPEEAQSDPLVELPLPLLFDATPDTLAAGGVEAALHRASAVLGTLAVVPWKRATEGASTVVPLIEGKELAEALPRLRGRSFAAVEWSGPEPADAPKLREAFPTAVVIARLPLDRKTAERVSALEKAGVGAFHLTADFHGECADGRFIKDALLAVHDRLVATGLREQVTLIASGGIVRAEHVPKAIICGADLVALDTAVWVALGAEFRGECRTPEALALEPVPPEWGAQRIMNFCAAWHYQLLEILSAMGLREVARLRGEVGRSMTFEELEKEAFGDLERA